MRIVLWTQPECPLCEEVKEHFASIGYEEHAAEDLLSGTEKDMDAMAQLAMQNMELPLVQIEGEWVNPRALPALAQLKQAAA